MATFYGTLTGKGNQLTATGTKNSGIEASVQSWHGSVTMELDHDPDGIWLTVFVDDQGSSKSGKMVFHGSIYEFKERFDNTKYAPVNWGI